VNILTKQQKDLELWTQAEVADHFGFCSNTIKNWRRKGLLSYFQAEGSNRKLYYRSEVEAFQSASTKRRKETGPKKKRVVRAKPRLSSDEDWRIS
jgi:hypothetical protein